MLFAMEGWQGLPQRRNRVIGPSDWKIPACQKRQEVPGGQGGQGGHKGLRDGLRHLGHILKYVGATATRDHRAVTTQLFSGQWGWELGQEPALMVIQLLFYCDHTPHAHALHANTLHMPHMYAQHSHANICTHTAHKHPHITHAHILCPHTPHTSKLHIHTLCPRIHTDTLYTCYAHMLTPHSTHSAPHATSTHQTHIVNVHNLQPPLHCTHRCACPAPRTLHHMGAVPPVKTGR